MPPSVRRTSKRLGLKTEASIRFERGADVAEAPPASHARPRSSRRLAPAVLSDRDRRYPSPRPQAVVGLRAARIRACSARTCRRRVVRILEALGFRVAAGPTQRWSVTVPTFRVDVAREVDLIEEVGRHYGYDRLPTTFPALTAARRHRRRGSPATAWCAGYSPGGLLGSCDIRVHRRTRRRRSVRLVRAGADRESAVGEVRGAAPVAAARARRRVRAQPPARTQGRAAVRDRQPVHERGRRACRCGRVDRRSAGRALGGAGAHGRLLRPQGRGRGDCRGARRRRRLRAGGQRISRRRTRREVPARAAGGEAALGSGSSANSARPSPTRATSPPAKIYVLELDLDALAIAAGETDRADESLPRYPSIVRDMSMLVDEALPAATVRGTIRRRRPDARVDRRVRSLSGQGHSGRSRQPVVAADVPGADRTLTDADVQAATDEIVRDALRAQHATGAGNSAPAADGRRGRSN